MTEYDLPQGYTLKHKPKISKGTIYHEATVSLKVPARYNKFTHEDIDIINRDFIKQKLAEAIDRLPEKEKLIISLYYSEELTLKEIGMTLNLSEARISQLHKRAVLRLRGYLSRSKSDIFN